MSILAAVNKIQESFSDGLCDLVSNISIFREQNAEPHKNLPSGVEAFTQTTAKLCQIARQVGKAYFSAFPPILADINKAADDAEKSTIAMVKALQWLMQNSDRKRGWNDLMESTRTISNCTIHLLEVIYGADLKRIEISTENLKGDINTLRANDVQKNAKGFNDAGVTAANRANQIGQYLKQRANDAESPLVKAKLNDDGDRLQQKAQSLINHINTATRNPNDANHKKELDSFLNEMEKDASASAKYAKDNATGAVKNEEVLVTYLAPPTKKPNANNSNNSGDNAQAAALVSNRDNDLEKEIRAKEKNVKDALGQLANASNSKNAQEYQKAVDHLKNAVNDYKNAPIPDRVKSNPENLAALNDARKDLDSLFPRVIETSKNNFDSPNNYYKNFHLNAARQFDRGLNRATNKVAPKPGQDELALRDAVADVKRIHANRKNGKTSPEDAQAEANARFRINYSGQRRAVYSPQVHGPSEELMRLWAKKRIGFAEGDDDEQRKLDTLAQNARVNELATIQEVENLLNDITVSSDCNEPQRVTAYVKELQGPALNRLKQTLANSGASGIVPRIEDAFDNLAQAAFARNHEPTDEQKLQEVHTAVTRAKTALVEAKRDCDPQSHDRQAHLELQKALNAIANVREAIANAEDDQTPINVSINFAHNQLNNAVNATNQLNQKEPNKGKHDAVHMAVVKLGEINNDFRPNTNTSQTSRPSLTIVEDAIEKVIETLNNDGESIQGMKYDNKPQAHALSQSASNVQDAFSLQVDNVAAGIKAAADQYENQVAKDISEHLALIAKYAREGDKRGMINQSKESANRIGDLIKILRDYAGRIGKNAAEKQLQDRLIQCANSLQNNATHLKILVSVKAASSEQNKDTDESLTAIIAGIGAHISEGLNALRITEETVFKQKAGGK